LALEAAGLEEEKTPLLSLEEESLGPVCRDVAVSGGCAVADNCGLFLIQFEPRLTGELLDALANEEIGHPAAAVDTGCTEYRTV
jgi:hypothetical protein